MDETIPVFGRVDFRTHPIDHHPFRFVQTAVSHFYSFGMPKHTNATEPQRLYRQQIFDYLRDAQTNSTGLVTCAGCGRSLEYEFMELDHILPRSEGGENYITNRILLCRPCNGRKSDRYTLRGLRERNKKDGWMRDEAGAESAQVRARRKADEVRETLG